MTLSELKTGLFGYKKASVYQYITSLEEQFSAKLVEKDAAMKQAAEQYQEKIQRLEEEVERLRKQCDIQREEQSVISGAILQAQRYAQEIRQEVQQEQQDARHRLEEASAEQTRQLEAYRSQIRAIRAAFEATLQEMDGTAQQLEREMEKVLEEQPKHNLTLFSRKPEPVA